MNGIELGTVLTVNVTKIIHEGPWTGSVGKTGIDKRPVVGPVLFADNCVAGDSILDRKVHGGYDAAVYAYAREDADWWEQELSRPVTNGKFGENLTTEGIDVNGATVGEHWIIGEVILEVSQPRIPCRVFAGFWDRPELIKEFLAAKRPGAYLRIIKEGNISAGDSIEIIDRPSHAVTIRDLFEAKSGERAKIREIAALTTLSPSWREWIDKLTLSNHFPVI